MKKLSIILPCTCYMWVFLSAFKSDWVYLQMFNGAVMRFGKRTPHQSVLPVYSMLRWGDWKLISHISCCNYFICVHLCKWMNLHTAQMLKPSIFFVCSQISPFQASCSVYVHLVMQPDGHLFHFLGITLESNLWPCDVFLTVEYFIGQTDWLQVSTHIPALKENEV